MIKGPVYEFHVDTVADDSEALRAMTGCQEAGFELFETTGLSDGRSRLYFRRPLIIGQPPLNGHARVPAVAVKTKPRR